MKAPKKKMRLLKKITEDDNAGTKQDVKSKVQLVEVSDNTKPEKINGRNCPHERRTEVRLDKHAVAERKARAVTYKIATTRSELEEAYSLVWKNYVETGFQADDDTKIRFTKYHLLPESRVFVANFREGLLAEPKQFDDRSVCIGTVSLILDSPMGLPLDELCGKELSQVRAEGRKIAEVVGFAVNKDYTQYKVFLHMFKLLFQYAGLVGVTDIVCTVTAKHSRFYRKVCLFEPVGELTTYVSAQSVQAQGHILNIKEARKKSEEFYEGKEFDANLHRFFFGEEYDEEERGGPISKEDLNYFATQRTDFLSQLVPKDLGILRSAYDNAGMDFPF